MPIGSINDSPINGYGPVDTDGSSNNIVTEAHFYDIKGNEIHIDDIVQVKPGVINLTTGNYTKPGDPLIEGTNTWGKVFNLVNEFPTKGMGGLQQYTQAVQVGVTSGKNQVVAYTVQPSGIATNRLMGGSSSLALSILNPIASLLNLHISGNSQVSNLLNAVSTLGQTLGLKGDSIKKIQDTWQKIMSYDNLVFSKYKEAENIYNTIGGLLFGKNKQQNLLQRTLGVLGAAQRISNYVDTNQLINKQNYSGNNLSTGISKIMQIFTQSEKVWNSLTSLIGGNSGTGSTNGVRTKFVNQPALPGNYSMIQFDTMPSEDRLEYNQYDKIRDNIIPEVTNSGTYNSSSYYKLMGRATEEGNQEEAEQINRIKTIQSNLNYRELTEEESRKIYPRRLEGLRVINNIKKTEFDTFISKPETINLLTNEDETQIQNAFNYPPKLESKREWIVNKVLKEENLLKDQKDLSVRQYDYQIKIDDSKVESISGMSIEDSLMEARKHLGLQVHGNKDIGKAIKYFLYNRYKNIDGGNLAYNRMFTHMFFTRPDLNLLYYKGPILKHLKNYSDVAFIWQRDPNLFKLLTDFKRTDESNHLWGNNFNLLLSNQIVNCEFKDETISKVETTKNWKDQKIIYGGSYTGRGDGEINCTFLETKDLAITNLFKLWIMYIDNVSTGVWSPSYNLKRFQNGPLDCFVDYLTLVNASVGADAASHVYTRTLDYAASAYSFKLNESGEEILYWTKYYGLIPVNLSLNHLNWQAGSLDSEVKTVNVTFAYSFKKDLSPISLLEFNYVSNVDDSKAEYFEPNYLTLFDRVNDDRTINYASGIRSGEPLVGAPFIAIRNNRDSIGETGTIKGFLPTSEKEFSLQLKFKPIPNEDNFGKNGDSSINYNCIYRANPEITQSKYDSGFLNSLLQSFNNPTGTNQNKTTDEEKKKAENKTN